MHASSVACVDEEAPARVSLPGQKSVKRHVSILIFFYYSVFLLPTKPDDWCDGVDLATSMACRVTILLRPDRDGESLAPVAVIRAR